MYFKRAFMYIMTALQFHFGFICKAVKIVYEHIYIYIYIIQCSVNCDDYASA